MCGFATERLHIAQVGSCVAAAPSGLTRLLLALHFFVALPTARPSPTRCRGTSRVAQEHRICQLHVGRVVDEKSARLRNTPSQIVYHKRTLSPHDRLHSLQLVSFVVPQVYLRGCSSRRPQEVTGAQARSTCSKSRPQVGPIRSDKNGRSPLNLLSTDTGHSPPCLLGSHSQSRPPPQGSWWRSRFAIVASCVSFEVGVFLLGRMRAPTGPQGHPPLMHGHRGRVLPEAERQ